MKGFPKHINSKRDVDNLLRDYPEKTKAWLKKHMESREGWHTVRKVESKADVRETKSVRVKTVTLDDKTELYEEHYGPIPGNAIDMLGLGTEDVLGFISGLE